MLVGEAAAAEPDPPLGSLACPSSHAGFCPLSSLSVGDGHHTPHLSEPCQLQNSPDSVPGLPSLQPQAQDSGGQQDIPTGMSPR